MEKQALIPGSIVALYPVEPYYVISDMRGEGDSFTEIAVTALASLL